MTLLSALDWARWLPVVITSEYWRQASFVDETDIREAKQGLFHIKNHWNCLNDSAVCSHLAFVASCGNDQACTCIVGWRGSIKCASEAPTDGRYNIVVVSRKHKACLRSPTWQEI
jgi:hypothetical protein